VPKVLQGKGYGAELTKRRIQMLLKLGVSEIRTEVEQSNQPMLRLLLKLGFTRV
jgi:RimJ/RimL family protein N-acetyltransferase